MTRQPRFGPAVGPDFHIPSAPSVEPQKGQGRSVYWSLVVWRVMSHVSL